jgi:hypothetical protein
MRCNLNVSGTVSVLSSVVVSLCHLNDIRDKGCSSLQLMGCGGIYNLHTSAIHSSS